MISEISKELFLRFKTKIENFTDKGVTSLSRELGFLVDMSEIKSHLQSSIERLFA